MKKVKISLFKWSKEHKTPDAEGKKSEWPRHTESSERGMQAYLIGKRSTVEND